MTRRWFPIGVRWTLSVVLLYGVFTETGVWTTCAVGLLVIGGGSNHGFPVGDWPALRKRAWKILFADGERLSPLQGALGLPEAECASNLRWWQEQLASGLNVSLPVAGQILLRLAAEEAQRACARLADVCGVPASVPRLTGLPPAPEI